MNSTNIETIDLNRPDSTQHVGLQLESTALSTVDRMRGSLVIDGPVALDQVKSDRAAVYALIKQGEEFFRPLKALAHQLHAKICAREKQILEPLRRLDEDQAAAIREYHALEDRARREREAAIAEEQRRDRERQAIRDAAEYERSGDHEIAAAILEEAVAAPAPVVALPDPVREVVSFTRRWRWKYVGGPENVAHTPPDVLRRALAVLPDEFKMPDEKKIGAFARSMKSSGRIPGIEIYAVDEPNH